MVTPRLKDPVVKLEPPKLRFKRLYEPSIDPPTTASPIDCEPPNAKARLRLLVAVKLSVEYPCAPPRTADPKL